MPLVIPITYFFILPRPELFESVTIPAGDDDEYLAAGPTTPYVPLPTDDDDTHVPIKHHVALSAADKWRLVKPLLLKYMLPLCKCPCPHTLLAIEAHTIALVCVYLVRRSKHSNPVILFDIS